MPEKKICESCRHYRPSNYFHGNFDRGFCQAPPLRTQRLKLPIRINDARTICDKEGDGIFTLYEPRNVSAAA
jgi:hypothetical protein